MHIDKEKFPLSSQEFELAEKSPSTASDLLMLSVGIAFPKDVKGLTILDIGSGASPALLTLRKQGAKAIGIDYRYRDLKQLKRSIDNYLIDPSASCGARLKKTYVRDEELIRRMRRNRDSFFGMTQRENKSYVGAKAGSLPFEDNTFDFCYSEECLSIALIENFPVFLQATLEAMRVLKTGGELQIHPWFKDQGLWGRGQAQNAQTLLLFLEFSKIPYSVEEVENSCDELCRLRITKPYLPELKARTK